MDDLVQFLRARLDEDERRARALVLVGKPVENPVPRHVLPRVLAETDAKRRLLDEHQPDGSGGCTSCALPSSTSARPWPCTTIKLLALPYADHPDYRNDWRP